MYIEHCMQCSMYGAMYRTRNGHAQHQFKVASQLINIIATTSVMGVITIAIDAFLSMIMMDMNIRSPCSFPIHHLSPNIFFQVS